jgi:hypothetical protein
VCKHSCLAGKEFEEEELQRALQLSMLSTDISTATAASSLITSAPSIAETTNVDADSAMVDVPPTAPSSTAASHGNSKSKSKSKSKGSKSGSSDVAAQSRGMLINAKRHIRIAFRPVHIFFEFSVFKAAF